MSVVALAVVPKPFCALSILSSCIVLREVLHPADQKLNGSIRDCLKNLALADIVGSLALFLTTWPIPAGLPDYFQNVGTISTCSAQGFFIEVGLSASILFSLNLSVLCLLIIRYNATESTLSKFQFWSQKIIWGYVTTFGVICLGLGCFNPATGYCWLNSYPSDCWLPDNEDCIRGQSAYWAIIVDVTLHFLGPLFGQIFLFVWLFRTVYGSENQQELRRNSRSSIPSLSSSFRQLSMRSFQDENSTTTQQSARINRTRSRSVAIRGILYICGYLMTTLVPLLQLALQTAQLPSDFVTIPATALLGTQGFWTLLVFMRNRKMLTPEGRFIKSKLHRLLMEDEVYHQQELDLIMVPPPVVTSTTGGGTNASEVPSSKVGSDVTTQFSPEMEDIPE